MGLLESLAELKDQPDKVAVDELDSPKKEEEVVEEEAAVEEEPEEKEEEPAEEDTKEAVSDEKQQKINGYQKRKSKEFEDKLAAMQEEREYFRKQNEELQRKLLETISPQKAAAEPEKDVSPEEDPEKWLINNITKSQQSQQELAKTIETMQMQMAMNSAKAELASMESAYAAKVSDYHQVMKHALDKMVMQEKYLNPKASEDQIRASLEAQRVQVAAKFAGMGQDPVDSLYNFMVNIYGKPQQQASQPDKKVDTFEAVKKNKAKSATPLTAGGRGSSGDQLTSEAARGLSLSDFAKLSAEDKKRLFG